MFSLISQPRAMIFCKMHALQHSPIAAQSKRGLSAAARYDLVSVGLNSGAKLQL